MQLNIKYKIGKTWKLEFVFLSHAVFFPTKIIFIKFDVHTYFCNSENVFSFNNYYSQDFFEHFKMDR